MTSEEVLELYGLMVQSECDYEPFEKAIEKAGGRCFVLFWEEHAYGDESTCPLEDLIDYMKDNGFRVYDDPRFGDWDCTGWIIFPPTKMDLFKFYPN